MSLNESTVYAQGKFVKYDDARIGLLTHGLHYGTGCFEGIRGYWAAGERELFLVHVRAHFERLAVSAKTLLMKMPHDVDELVDLTVELCTRNHFEENVYIRPVIFKAAEDIGVRLAGVPDAFAIIGVPFNRYYDEDAGLRVCVSSWRRIDDASIPARAKITGSYVNSALAKSEAQMNGFDEAILLSADGHVAEGSAENLFLVKDDVIYTTDPSQNILEGITRDCAITLAREKLGLQVIERMIDRSELYGAEEIFVTGTAVGITHISSVDHRDVGDGTRGPVARAIAEAYERVVYGRDDKYRDWLTPAYANRPVTVG